MHEVELVIVKMISAGLNYHAACGSEKGKDEGNIRERNSYQCRLNFKTGSENIITAGSIK